MKISFDIKKGVVAKFLFTILLLTVAISLVFGQASYVSWSNPAYPPGWPGFSSQVSPSFPSHSLFLITSGSTNISVDSNGNGIIDTAEYSRWAGVSAFSNNTNSLQGILPTSNVIDKGCVTLDTSNLGGDAFVGSAPLNLTISNTITFSIGGNPPSINENICEDGNGCSYNMIRYSQSAGTINQIQSGNSRYYHQLPRVGGIANWMDATGPNTGNNGDTAKSIFVGWNSPAGSNWLDIADDDSAILETSPDYWSVQDYDGSRSFIVTVCD